jgi:hypothetical protein
MYKLIGPVALVLALGGVVTLTGQSPLVAQSEARQSAPQTITVRPDPQSAAGVPAMVAASTAEGCSVAKGGSSGAGGDVTLDVRAPDAPHAARSNTIGVWDMVSTVAEDEQTRESARRMRCANNLRQLQ